LFNIIILPEIANGVIYIRESDHHEREGYTVDLQAGNHENDLHAAQDGAFDAQTDLLVPSSMTPGTPRSRHNTIDDSSGTIINDHLVVQPRGRDAITSFPNNISNINPANYM
jgi:hypothetical protein